MKDDKYVLRVTYDFCVYEFESRGKNGTVIKIVKFTKWNQNEYYNMGFGDKDKETGEVNDIVITNNGDIKKILATLIMIVYFFTEKYPYAWIYIKGTNPVRTRLYRIVINNNLPDLQKDFLVLGFHRGEWRSFLANLDFTAFLIHRKII